MSQSAFIAVFAAIAAVAQTANPGASYVRAVALAGAQGGYGACIAEGRSHSSCIDAQTGYGACIRNGYSHSSCVGAKGGYKACVDNGYGHSSCKGAKGGYTH